MSRKLAIAALVAVLMAACAPSNYTPPPPPTPQQRMESDIAYCNGGWGNYQYARAELARAGGQGGFWGTFALSSTIASYESVCYGITLGYPLPRDVLLDEYRRGLR